ncbi:MAG: ABC-type antimicrobial peptide transport system permease subunit [Alteromonadaceae bacterium]|jgi:ABC-type antimicrobial peptide transport system permease subunit
MIKQPLLQGRYFTEADFKDQNKIVIVNEKFADQLKGNGEVLGLKVKLGNSEVYTIVGIVNGIKLPNQSNVPTRFYPLVEPWSTDMLIKLKNEQTLSRKQVIQIIKSSSSIWSVFDYQQLSMMKNNFYFTQTITATTTAALAIITFILSAIGSYGILSYTTQMRRFEMGTRMAVGAKQWDLILLIVKDNSRSIFLGIISSILLLLVIGNLFNKLFTSYLSWQLFPIFLITLGLISLMSFIACYLPLRQYINSPVIHSLKGNE